MDHAFWIWICYINSNRQLRMFCPHISTTLASTTYFIQCSMWLTSYLNMLSVFHVSIQGDSLVPMCHDTHKWGSLLSSKGITSCQSCQFLLKDSVHFYLLQRTQQHTWFENWQDMCTKELETSIIQYLEYKLHYTMITSYASDKSKVSKAIKGECVCIKVFLCEVKIVV